MTTPFKKFIELYNGRLPTERDPNYLELLRMSKYRILAIPDVKPTKCANCGSTKADGRQYIDFGLDVDWFGTVFLCGFCLKDIAQAMGLFSDSEEKLKAAIDDKVSLLSLQTQGDRLYDKFTELIKEFETYYASLHSVRDDPSTTASDSVVGNETAADREGSAKTKPRTTKPTSSSGSKNLPSLADLLKSDS
jgi:hypothetical protein